MPKDISKFIVYFYSAIITIFFSLNLIFLNVSDDIRIFSSTDPLDYINSAKSLIECGSFSYLELNCIPKTWNTPGYPIFIAIHMLISENYIFYLVLTQIFLLLLTALISSKLIEKLNPKLSIWVFSLILFNPNSFSTAHLIQTETIFTFFLTIIIFIMFKYQNLKAYFFLGLLCGINAYIRPAFFYFCLISPFIFFLHLRLIVKKNFNTSILFSLIGGLVAILLVSFWVNRNQNLFNESIFVSNKGFMVWVNLIEMYDLNNIESNLPDQYEKIMDQVSNNKNYYYGTNQTPYSSNILMEKAKAQLNFPFKLFIIAGSKSMLNLFFSGGATNFERLLNGNQDKYLEKNKFYYNFTNIPKYFFSRLFSIESLPVIYSILIKLFSFVGICYFIVIRNFSLLAVCVLPLIYLTPLYGFFGQSRFRVPMEPSFIILAVAGASVIINHFLKEIKKR